MTSWHVVHYLTVIIMTNNGLPMLQVITNFKDHTRYVLELHKGKFYK